VAGYRWDVVGKRHQKRLDRIARRKAARAAKVLTEYRVGSKGSVYKNGMRIGFIEGTAGHLFSLGLYMSGEKVEIVVLQEPDTKGEIEFNRKMYNKLQKRYDTAVADNEEQFVFEGFEFLTNYAKYMLEFLDARLV